MAIVAVLVAIWVGYGLLVSEELPLVRAISLLGMALLVAAPSLRGWLDAAGLVLVAAAMPWAAYAAAWLLDGLIAGRRIDCRHVRWRRS